MSYFLVSAVEASELASALALASGAPRTAAELVGQGARDDVLGMPASGAALRALAAVRLEARPGRS